MRRALALLGLFWPAALVCAAPLVAQAEIGSQDEEESQLERMLRLAREGSAVVRPQAAQRLVAMGEPALLRVLEECGDSPAEMAELGNQLVEAIGGFANPRVRAKLWEAIGDPDFPWRPAAARALSKKPVAGEGQRLAVLAQDPLAMVREAAIVGMGKLEDRSHVELVRALLADPDDRVRRMAVRVLYRWNEACAVSWLIEDLKRDDRYFELQTGKLARYQSLRLLEGELQGHVKRNFGFSAEKTWDDPSNAAAREKIEAFIEKLCGGELLEPPMVARASKATEGDVLGLEIRSCRKGEFYLRWNVSDVLYVGTGNAVAIELPEGSVASLLAAAAPRIEELGKKKLWGQPGCDLEQLHFRREVGARTRTFRVSKGQKLVEGLRPTQLGELVALLIQTLPQTGEDPRVHQLRARVTDALQSVGGPLPSD